MLHLDLKTLGDVAVQSPFHDAIWKIEQHIHLPGLRISPYGNTIRIYTILLYIAAYESAEENDPLTSSIQSSGYWFYHF
ncbi:hypothetical protein [Paenibacillus sp. FSL K6-0108]|uniref:hypothetical protein n=1 Tax=Paenibacillus sp. FSL K6-0108 TaxID=2921417 RepID=UPI00324B5602